MWVWYLPYAPKLKFFVGMVSSVLFQICVSCISRTYDGIYEMWGGECINSSGYRAVSSSQIDMCGSESTSFGCKYKQWCLLWRCCLPAACFKREIRFFDTDSTAVGRVLLWRRPPPSFLPLHSKQAYICVVRSVPAMISGALDLLYSSRLYRDSRAPSCL